MVRGPYTNEDGDWWVAVEDANYRTARAAVLSCLGYRVPDEGTLVYKGKERVPLHEEEVGGSDDCANPACRHGVLAWHFVENPR